MKTAGKIASLEVLADRVRAARAAGEVVVLCHGCFDIVHPGHVRHLQQAAALGDRLIVTITGDASLNKGVGRPLIPQELRAENLAALDCVDWVAMNPDATAEAMLRLVQPDVYVKGREYEHNRDPRFATEREAVEACGGRVVFTSGDVVFSSTALIGAMQQTADPRHGAVRALLDAHGLDAAGIEAMLAAMRGRRVVIVGETVVDTYVSCDRPEVADEGPMLTLRPLGEESFDGGAAGVARHLAAMGARPTLVTALPRSPAAEALRRRLCANAVEVEALEVSESLVHTRRYLVGSNKMVRVEEGRSLTLDTADRAELAALLAVAAREAEAVALVDHGHGLVSEATLAALCAQVRAQGTRLTGGASGRRSNLTAMRGLDLLCASEAAMRDALREYDEGLTAAAWRLLHATQSHAAVLHLGAEGTTAFTRNADAELPDDAWAGRLGARHVPALVEHPVDELGCGESMLAACTLALTTGQPVAIAALLGAVASASQARRLGHATIGAADLRRALLRMREARLACDTGGAVVATV